MRVVRASLWPLLAYGGLTLLFGLSLLPRLGTVVANDLGDPLLNAWILWWNARQVPLTRAWWNAPAFFPAPDTLALSEHLLGLSPFTTPIIWLTGNAALAYNSAFLLTFLLSAAGAYALALTLTASRSAAFVAGLLYAFAPYRMSQFGHVQVLASFWMPVALAALHAYLGSRRALWLVPFGVATLLQGLANGYYLLFFPVLVALWLLWFPPPGRRLVTLGAVGGALLAGMLVLVPLVLRYREVHERWGLRRSLWEMVFYSPKLTDLLSGPGDLWLWGSWLRRPGPEADIFPGLTAILLLAAAVIGARPQPSPHPTENVGYLPRRVRLGLSIVATVFSLAVLCRLVFGPLRFELWGMSVSVQRLSKPLAVAVFAGLIVAATGPVARRVIRSRSPLAFYVTATVAMWVLSFGPAPAIGATPIWHWAPYRWLTLLPGFDGLRVPGRFAMLAALCLSAAGGLALARLQSRVGHVGRVVLVTGAALGAIAEGWRDVPVHPLPEPSLVTSRDVAGAVIELPLDDSWLNAASLYRSIGHGHPVVNGYSGHTPPHYRALMLALAQRDPNVFTELAALGVRHVVVLHDRDASGEGREYVAAHQDVQVLGRSATQTHYLLPAVPARRAGPGDAACWIANVSASVGQEGAGKLLDGDLVTRWSTHEPQSPGQHLIVDLGTARVVTGVELSLGAGESDFPRRLQVEGSRDRRAWTVGWRGGTGALAMAGILEDPRRAPIRIPLPATETRYLRFTQLGRDRRFSWSVAELTVRGCAQAAGAPGVSRGATSVGGLGGPAPPATSAGGLGDPR